MLALAYRIKRMPSLAFSYTRQFLLLSTESRECLLWPSLIQDNACSYLQNQERMQENAREGILNACCGLSPENALLNACSCIYKRMLALVYRIKRMPSLAFVYSKGVRISLIPI
jgi:hypothetical protein